MTNSANGHSFAPLSNVREEEGTQGQGIVNTAGIGPASTADATHPDRNGISMIDKTSMSA